MSAFGQASLRWSPGSITQPNSPSGLCPAKSEILTILSSQAPLRHTWQGRFFLVLRPPDFLRIYLNRDSDLAILIECVRVNPNWSLR